MREDERLAELAAIGARAGSTGARAGSAGTPAGSSDGARAVSLFEYGPHPDQFVEVYGDPASASATVILVHGGYFRPRTDLTHARPMAVALAAAGALVYLVEYRREGGQPNPLDDVTAAIDAISAGLPGRGASEQAGQTIIVTGHSAGGALVLAWAGHQGVEGPAVRLRPLAPVTDLFREVAEGLGEGAVLDYMGLRPEEDLEAYRQQDPRSRALLIPDRIDVRLVHGDADGIVDVEFSRVFPAEVTVLQGANHVDVVDPDSPYFPRVVELLLG